MLVTFSMIMSDPVDNNILIIKNLPSSLTVDEKKSFLKCFGCETVRVMPSSGFMKHSAFASFANNQLAKSALNRIHQLKVLDSVLTAQFARKAVSDDAKMIECHEEDSKPLKSTSASQEPCKCSRQLHKVAPQLNYASDPGCKYMYPAPNADILINICGALLSVPKFYTQVLHLMNKLNLYPPFSTSLFPPPLLLEYFNKLPSALFPAANVNAASFAESETSKSTSESEMMSDDSDCDKFNIFPKPGSIKTLKRKSNLSFGHPQKKLQHLMQSSSKSDHSELKTVDSIPAVFKDYTGEPLRPLITLRMPTTLADQPHLPSDEAVCAASDQAPDERSGFGKILPVKISQKSDENNENSSSFVTKIFTTEKQLDSGRLSERELRCHPLFKNYNPGQPSCRLYVKNLHKKVTEKDLKHIFGYFVDVSSEAEVNMFDVMLMSHGRMKGQAFVGLPSVDAAKRALQLTNGFQLMGKPIVVTFARSAKPKNPVETGR